MSFSHITDLKQKRFAGLSQRTSNALEMTEERRIPALWDQFWQQDMRILFSQAEKDQSIIALYSNYEQETNGFYTFSVGAFQEDSGTLPEPYENIDLPASAYAVFTSRIGPIEEIVYETWKEIWTWDKRHLRTFTGDFEMYDQSAAVPQRAQVNIYVAIKN
ncbi:AraC family transcriptional regulator [Bacillus subtilis]|uniref:Effector of transcriptional regulator n=1 Tax=Bacillus inaquosorum KCTC 13429 TaxID=1236548 RepID=A0A9W5LF21_9BACI|nr:GyrI-like domain-containing protein [Bacillus inaquosorum]RKQ26498.1 AraC family transcriptional regulator [Bacillus subtilis]AWM17257.1 AraC family transcriptional regulator [Bacillus inaquosorum]ELS59528.1 putative effector of transcriptional regulator [Bacillus inaquosorum KCTC 13429]MCY8069679.1 GyrI-like domain-containing protein [Bacillus inaquosorum]MCY9079850.1 GyrI-like domain-containing protein [Bacillus inaquosorum]